MSPATIAIIIVVVLLMLFCIPALTGAPYVPSREKEVRDAFKKLYPLSKKDFIIDLGCGDGKVQKIASEFSAGGLGIEINPILAIVARWRLRKLPNQKVICSNMFAIDFPKETTVVYVFGDGRDIKRIVKFVKAQSTKLGKPIHLISHAFEVLDVKPIKQHRAYHLYLIKGGK